MLFVSSQRRSLAMVRFAKSPAGRRLFSEPLSMSTATSSWVPAPMLVDPK